MKRIWTAVLLVGGLLGALIFGTAQSEATTLTLDFNGTVVQTGGGMHGTITINYGTPDATLSGPGLNYYGLPTATFSFTADGTTKGFTTSLGSATVSNDGSLAPVGLTIAAADSGVVSFILGPKTFNPTFPLLTLETIPTSDSAWTALYGAFGGGGVFLLGSTFYNYKVSTYTIAATPIPGAVLLFATALIGLGLVGHVRRRTARLAACA